ncbi:MAG TPA: ABC transporter ATP-binding protein [Acidimicrobiales bacterium]|jgi:NitT/TauT family transport system ATP-binding protein
MTTTIDHAGTVTRTGAAADAAAPAVALSEVSKAFGSAGDGVLALDRVSLEVPAGQFVCLVGASGCGKSTLLNLIAGLDSPTSGAVGVPGGDAALMFQDAALFPWLTVARNVELPLQFRKVGKTDRRRRVSELLEMVHLGAFATKRPHELSGGMRQRVALARALAQHAPILLMDEPFGALDAITRDLLHDELERVWRDTGLTVVFVTHNVREAVRLGDRVVMLSSRPGRVVADFTVDVPRPRRIESPEVAAISSEILDRLRREVARHGDR